MTYISSSEDNVGICFSYPLTERHEQRHLALRTVENCFSRLELQRMESQKVVLPDNRVITYQIDARGRRVGKKVDGVFQYGFIYGDQLNPIAKVDENGVILEQYVYGLKSNVPEYIIKNGVKYKIISDHLGSPLAVWQEGERTSPVLERKYDSFGNILEESGSFELVFCFAGGIWDKDTGLVRFGVRDYDSETGRWTSKEPLGFAGSRNFYVYAGNDGVNFLDLDGNAYKCRRGVHRYLCTNNGHCGGFGAVGNNWDVLSKSSSKKFKGGKTLDIFDKNTCQKIDSEKCIDECIDKEIDGNRPKEYKLFKYNCWDWARDTYSKCAKKCGKKDYYDSVYYKIPIIKFPKLPQPIPHHQKPKY